MIELRVSEPDPIVLEAEEQDQASLAVLEAFVSGGEIPAYTGSYNVTPTQSQQTLETNGKKMVRDVKVAPIPSQYIIPEGTLEVTQNGQQSVREYENVDVNVPAPTGEKTINVTQNGTTTEDVANYATAKVVTNVPASAVDTGTKTINSNGTHDVVGYASAAVNVPNTYSQSDEGKVVQSGALVSQSSDTVTQNGTYDTTLKNEVVVNVSGGQAAFVGIANDTIVFGEGTSVAFGSAPTEDVVFNLQDFYINTHNFYRNIGVGPNGKKTITLNCKGFSRRGTSNMNQMFNACKAFDTVVFNCSVNPWVELGAYAFAGANCQVENVLGTPISLYTWNLQGTTADSAFKGNTYLKEIRFYENYSQTKIGFPNSSLLSDDSLISLANGLTYASEASTLTLHATSKAKLPNITGTVSQVTRDNETYDKFTASASGTVTLEYFISTTKGWTIA